MPDNGVHSDISVHHVLRFLGRVCERHNPLTAAQLNGFLRNPDGPTIPDDLLEVWRLPGAYSRALLRGIAVTSDGQPCFVAVIADKLITVCGKLGYLLPDAPDPTSRQFGCRVLGFDPSGKPITILRDGGAIRGEDGAHTAEDAPRGGMRFYRGSAFLFEESALGDFRQAAVLRDDRIIVGLTGSDPLQEPDTVAYYRHDGTRDTDRKPFPVWRLQGLFAVSNGECYGIWGNEMVGGSFIVGHIGPREVTALWNFDNSVGIPREIVETDNGIGVLIRDYEGHPSLYTLDGRTLLRDHIGKPEYSANYAELPDGRVVYMTRETLDEHRLALVVNGVRQPYAFECVSTCFRSADEGWCYWAAYNERTLCRMRVPTPTDAEIAAAADGKPWHSDRA